VLGLGLMFILFILASKTGVFVVDACDWSIVTYDI